MKTIFYCFHVVAVLSIAVTTFCSNMAASQTVWFTDTELTSSKPHQRFIQAHERPTATAFENTRQIVLPMPDGTNLEVTATPTQVLSAEIAEKYPEIKTYRVQGPDGIYGTVEITPEGMQALLNTREGRVQILPEQYYTPTSTALTYRSQMALKTASSEPKCTLTAGKGTADDFEYIEEDESDGEQPVAAKKFGDEIRVYRVAIAATIGYRNAVSNGTPTAAKAFAHIVIAVNRVNEILERDVGVRLELVSDESLVADSSSSFPSTMNQSMLNAGQLFIDTHMGNGNYDMGHVMTTVGGGLASVASACDATRKAQGASGLANPTTDVFYIDLLAHEMGHQLGATHTFNGHSGFCLGNRQSHSNGTFQSSDPRSRYLAASAYEVGSGSTIMSYAGICQGENLQAAADAYFHGRSIEQIREFVEGEIPFSNTKGNICGRIEIRSLTLPNVIVTDDGKTIPALTPFKLKASGTTSGTYTWEQFDLGDPSTSLSMMHTDQGEGPLLRSQEGSSDGVRLIPAINALKTNNMSAITGERLPSTTRELNFRVTLREGDGGIDQADMRINVDGNSGPFRVNAPLAGIERSGFDIVPVSWDVANTNQSPINCEAVDILFSSDSGESFTEVLASQTPNDGQADVVLPNIPTPEARLQVICSDNIFFSFSPGQFTVNAAAGTSTVSVSPLSQVKNESDPVFVYQMERSGDLSEPLTVNYQVVAAASQSASASDFEGGEFPSGSITFSADQAEQTLTITVASDGVDESSESFVVLLESADDSVSLVPQVTGTIEEGSTAPSQTTTSDAGTSSSGGGGISIAALIAFMGLGWIRRSKSMR